MNDTVRSTSLHDIRDFLSKYHRDARPWDDPKTALNNLYTLLSEKNSDPVFWSDLKDLTTRLEDRRVLRSNMRGSQVLGETSMEKLIDDLRSGISGGSRQIGLSKWVSRSISVTSLFAFMILGTAVSCDTDSGGDGGSSAACVEAQGEDFTEDEEVVFCNLVDIIKSADIPDSVKEDILACLPELDGDVRENLLDQFQGMTDENIAATLEDLASYGSICDTEYYPYDDDDDDH